MQAIKGLWPSFAFKAHQIAGIQWMLQREIGNPKGGILCDEMGLGKTMQMVGLIKNGINTTKRSLLVAPVAVLEQWATVITRAGMGVVRPAKHGWTLARDDLQVCMIGYEMAARRPELLASYEWDRIIYDEAHRLGSGNKSTEIAISVSATAKWLLTATPIVNRLKDLANLLTIIGVETPFIGFDAMRPMIEKYVMARTMDQLRASMPDAPPKPEFRTHVLDFDTEDEAQFYRCMTGAIQKRWRALESENALEKLQLFMRLRQLSLHPQVYIAARKKAIGKLYTRPDWTGSSTKFEAIKKLVADDSWIVFCHFRKEMEMLKEMIGERALIYNGGMTTAQKEEVLKQTHEPGKILLVQLQSGGVGLNLQHFNKIIFTGPWWAQALMDQAVGRAVRIGQRAVVQVHHMILKEEESMNIDQFMRDKAREKGDLCKKVLEAATSLLK